MVWFRVVRWGVVGCGGVRCGLDGAGNRPFIDKYIVVQYNHYDMFNYQHSVYLNAKEECFNRSDGMCQLCGQEPADHAHHWKERYDAAENTKPEHLTALCSFCHDEIATPLRRFTRRGGNRAYIASAINQAIGEKQCSSKLPSRESLQSLCMTSLAAWTNPLPQIKKRHCLPNEKVETEQNRTQLELENSKPLPRSGSRSEVNLEYRKGQYEQQ